MVIYISIIYIFGSQWFMVIPPLAAHQSMSVHLAAEGPKALGGKLLQVRDRTAIFTLRPRPSHGTMESPWKFRQGKGGFQKSEVNMNIMKYHEISWNIMKYHEISWISIESTCYQYLSMQVIRERTGKAWEFGGCTLPKVTEETVYSMRAYIYMATAMRTQILVEI